MNKDDPNYNRQYDPNAVKEGYSMAYMQDEYDDLFLEPVHKLEISQIIAMICIPIVIIAMFIALYNLPNN